MRVENGLRSLVADVRTSMGSLLVWRHCQTEETTRTMPRHPSRRGPTPPTLAGHSNRRGIIADAAFCRRTRLRGPVVGRKNHYGSRSLRGTEVAALFYTLCETARLVGIDPQAYLLRAAEAAIATPGTITLPEALTESRAT